MGTTTARQTVAPPVARSHISWIVVVATAARIATAVLYFRTIPIRPLTNWGYENVSIALALIHGQGYSSPFYFPSGPTAFLPPGYPLLIATCMRLLGTGIAATIGMITFQIVLSILTVVVVHRATTRYFGARAANFASLICALAEPMLFAPLYIWDTCLSALILVTAVAVAPDLRRRSDFAAAGVACAVAALINPALLLSLIAIAGWAAWRARTFPLIGILAFVIALSPWTIRNYAVMHAFVPLRSNVGYELWQGNHPGSDGETPAMNTPAVNAVEYSLFQSEGEIGYMQQKSSLAKTWIKAHPREFATLSVRRFVRFWIGSSKAPAPITVPLVAAALIGFALLWRWRQIFVLFALPLVIYPLPYYITHSDVRFQYVLDPLLAILAGYACESFFAWCGRRAAPLPMIAATLE